MQEESTSQQWCETITSPIALELISFLSENPGLLETPEGISMWSGLPAHQIAEVIERLVDARVLGKDNSSAGAVYSYAPAGDIRERLASLIEQYRKDPHSVVLTSCKEKNREVSERSGGLSDIELSPLEQENRRLRKQVESMTAIVDELSRRNRELSAVSSSELLVRFSELEMLLHATLEMDQFLNTTVDWLGTCLKVPGSMLIAFEPGSRVRMASRGQADPVAETISRWTTPQVLKLGQSEFTEGTVWRPIYMQDDPLGMLGVWLNGTNYGPADFTFLAERLADPLHNCLRHSYAKQQAITDGLTGLFNLRFFRERLATEFQTALRIGQALSLIFLDIDHFKSYNDTHGHEMGNVVLSKVSELLQQTVRAVDIPVRYGGEEFAVILPGTGLDDACAVAERIRIAVEEEPFPFSGTQPNGRLTVSLGIASFPESARTPEELLSRADACMYHAKEHGRNRISNIYVDETKHRAA